MILVVVGINRFLNATTAPSPFDERFYVQFHTFTHAVASVALKLPELISRIAFSGGGVNLDVAELQRLADAIYFPRDLLTSGHLTSNNFEHPQRKSSEVIHLTSLLIFRDDQMHWECIYRIL